MRTIKWEKYTEAPIPDYHDRAGRFRIYKSQGFWKLQDRQSPDHPEPIIWAETFAQAKEEATYLLALANFNTALANTPPADVESRRIGCGLWAGRFACQYTKPEKNQVLYTRIYNIFWNHFHKELEVRQA